jgi:hypothetical protein
MALTKVTKSGITDNSIDADKIEDGTIVAADIADGTITSAKLTGSIANNKLANSTITVNGTSVSLGGSVSAGSIEWQAVKTAAFNAVAGEGYFVNTTSGAITVTLPASPSAGDTIAIKDYAGTYDTNALTIARNGKNIQGVANDSEISTNRASIVLVYIDATKGWLYTNESNVADLGLLAYITATGGTITTSGDFKIHSFTGDGCFAVSQIGVGAGPSTVDYLVVAGGGGGSTGIGGGGGAGGYRESKDTTVNSPHTASPLAATTGITVTAQTYPITVGGGGSGAGTPGFPGGPTTLMGTNGSNSIFATITSAGGGAGSPCGPGPVQGGTRLGNSGGSGGGGGAYTGASNNGGAGNTPPVNPSQGNTGGTGATGQPFRGSGGGGAGATGTNGTGPTAGPGGNGATTSISASSTTYAGGGGGAGGAYGNPGGGTGGSGGGGAGNSYSPPSTFSGGAAGSTNTGGGGGSGAGGEGNAGGFAGGSGIVIIRYKFQ